MLTKAVHFPREWVTPFESHGSPETSHAWSHVLHRATMAVDQKGTEEEATAGSARISFSAGQVSNAGRARCENA